ncbi:diguanylate cyclase/phosphodiesterase [Marinobacter santoriniensis NKSG1]|uniref:Diguanylate cyclase/phosphodiesterase n=1 Tax=Marinobacter santoriniensis NKSG1 TaxID=1288826 RepID=M7CRX3_9GAMM|nr:EAL domain-containing protein [Marinobacter santoriniensis]EMP54865.1 diguanylate cyclase/phosphodiesterase [Marinobacter santoriniensis NKSG1]
MNLQRVLRFLALLSLLAVCSTASGNDIEVNEVTPSTPISAHFQYWEDPRGGATIDDVRQLPPSQWQNNESGNATFGMTESAYWLRFPVSNRSSERLNLIAELAYAPLDDAVFHVFENGREIRTFRTGDTHPFYPRDVDNPNLLLRFSLAPGETKTVYARVQTAGTMVIPLRIWRENRFFESAANEQKLHFFYYGSLAVIVLINLAVFLTLRERLYLYYALAVTGYVMFFASIKGFTFQHLYPDFPQVHARVLLASMPFLALFSLLFCRDFLKVREHSPKLDMALRAMMVFEFSFLMVSLVISYNAAIMLSSVSALVFFSLLLIAGPVSWAAGVRAGAFFTVAWTPLTIGVLATAGRSLGVFPENFFTEYAMQIGSGLEAFILTLALADRLYWEREDKIKAQAENLRQEKARSEAQNQLTEAMTHDPVTGLPNRNRFERMVNQQLQQHPGGHYMVGVARITRLDEINRTLGLTRSDRLLKDIAAQMTELAGRLPIVKGSLDHHGREERVYQLSGDSFGVFVDAASATDNFQALNEALRKLSEPIYLDSLAIELHPKFGASAFPMHGNNAAQLIRNAHVGMEIAPHGPFETGVYSPDYDIYSESRLTLMSDLREALHSDQTQLHYQPKIDLATGRVIGLEALIRWHHPERGDVGPSEFIPLAEETGVIREVTRWALDRGIQDLARLGARHQLLGLSVNISARDLMSRDLPAVIEDLMGRYSVAPERLTLELTETAAMDDPESGLKALQALADIGLQVSIDDFGSGYSSLSYLKQLPVSEIKLDRSLVIDIGTSESARVIVETAINMAHGLGYRIVAEGVETDDVAELLRDMHCDTLQGFWLSRPIGLDVLPDWLDARRSLAHP